MNIQEFIINTIPTHLRGLHVEVALSCLQFVLALRNWFQFPPQVETQPSLERMCKPYTLCYLRQANSLSFAGGTLGLACKKICHIFSSLHPKWLALQACRAATSSASVGNRKSDIVMSFWAKVKLYLSYKHHLSSQGRTA